MEHQIMLSVHCASMLSHAEQLRVFLVDEGYTVFLCSEMQAGVNYRQAICENSAKCKVFVPFINSGWCNSSECEFEFNIALAQSLKSPTRTPYIIPILLEEFSFYDKVDLMLPIFPVVVGLLKNAQGIAAKVADLDLALWTKVLGVIARHRDLIPANPPSRASAVSAPSLKLPASNPATKPAATLKPAAAAASKPMPPRSSLAPSSTNRRSPSPTPLRSPAPNPSPLRSPVPDARIPTNNPLPQPPSPNPRIPTNTRAPINSSSHPTNPQVPPAAAPTRQPPNPALAARVPVRQPISPPVGVNEPPLQLPTYPTYVMELPPVPPTNLEALRTTALQLLQDISILSSRIKIGGSPTFTEVKVTLEGVAEDTTCLKPTKDTETPLRALMDFLSKIKETCEAVQFSGGAFPYFREMMGTLKKLETIVKDPIHTTLFVGEFITDEETREFWERFFGKNEYSVTWPRFARALVSDARCASIMSEEDTACILQDLLLNVDHYNTGHVVCHRLADFVGLESLSVALQKYTQKPTPYRISESASVKFPLLLWIDDYPENNRAMVQYAKELGIHVVHMDSTTAAKEWLKNNDAVLKAKQVHIITDNVRNGANTVLDLNAGEDIIRFVRGRRSKVPILVYCGDINYAKYVAKYEMCSAGNQASDCQSFIEQLASLP